MSTMAEESKIYEKLRRLATFAGREKEETKSSKQLVKRSDVKRKDKKDY